MALSPTLGANNPLYRGEGPNMGQDIWNTSVFLKLLDLRGQFHDVRVEKLIKGDHGENNVEICKIGDSMNFYRFCVSVMYFFMRVELDLKALCWEQTNGRM